MDKYKRSIRLNWLIFTNIMVVHIEQAYRGADSGRDRKKGNQT